MIAARMRWNVRCSMAPPNPKNTLSFIVRSMCAMWSGGDCSRCRLACITGTMPVVTIGRVRNVWRGGLGSSMGKNSAKPVKTKNVTPAVTPWGKNRVKNTETGNHVLIMPGIGYTVDRPLLYWAAQALAANGWFVDRLDLKLTESVEFPEMIACMERVVDEWRKAALEHAAESGEEPHLLVVTKSLSTLSYPHSAKLGLRVVLLTPVLNPPPFDKHKSVIPAPLPGTAGSPMPLICAGDADPYYDDAKAHLLTDHVRTYAGANHSIEVPDDWQTSLDYLKQVTQAIVEYAG